MPQNSHPLIRLYKQECNHGTCLYIDASVRSFFRCTKSITIFGGLTYQGCNIKYKGVSKMAENSMLEAVKNCLIQRSKVHIALSLAWNYFIYLLSNALCAGYFDNDFILVAYYRDNLACLAPKLGLCASTYKLSTGEVRNDPRQSLSPWLYMGSSICK